MDSICTPRNVKALPRLAKQVRLALRVYCVISFLLRTCMPSKQYVRVSHGSVSGVEFDRGGFIQYMHAINCV